MFAVWSPWPERPLEHSVRELVLTWTPDAFRLPSLPTPPAAATIDLFRTEMAIGPAYATSNDGQHSSMAGSFPEAVAEDHSGLQNQPHPLEAQLTKPVAFVSALQHRLRSPHAERVTIEILGKLWPRG